jgi:coiled-coil domain-containing protein 130
MTKASIILQHPHSHLSATAPWIYEPTTTTLHYGKGALLRLHIFKMQGFNMGRYVPPEHEGVISANKLSGKHALGARANKSSQGILTVRFEMPFPIWCTHCPKPTIIGQGVRFNAEKKKVGNYYSTPIFSFRMKHVACGGTIEIRTDPKNTAYVVHEGARKRDTGEDKVLDGDIKILSTEEREARRSNAFASLEGKNEDKARAAETKLRIEELQDVQDKDWEDPYERNRKLRSAFRVERKEREHDAGVAGRLQDKMSLGIELLPENEDDVRRAGYIEFGGVDPMLEMSKAISKPLFAPENTTKTSGSKSGEGKRMAKKPKAEQLAAKRRADFAAEVRDNTRAKMDPFLMDRGATKEVLRRGLGIKRKRDVPQECSGVVKAVGQVAGQGTGQALIKGLVDYDSE